MNFWRALCQQINLFYKLSLMMKRFLSLESSARERAEAPPTSQRNLSPTMYSPRKIPKGNRKEENMFDFILEHPSVLFIVTILVILVIREIVCWYWKINEHLEEQQKQTEILEEIRDILKSRH